MHDPLAPDTERLDVPDLFGLVSRKVRDKSYQPKVTGSLSSTPVENGKPAKKEYALVTRALAAFDGTMAFDKWLNLESTTHTQVKSVRHVLNADSERCFTYLEACGLKPDFQSAGFFTGKIDAVMPICMLREIFLILKANNVTGADEIKDLVRPLSRYVALTHYWNTLYFAILEIAPHSDTLMEFETKLFARFTPIDNALHAKRFLSKRVKKTLFQNLWHRLKLPVWNREFEMSYALGLLTRISHLDFRDPYWNHTTIMPLEKMLWLSRKVAMTDFEFASAHLYTGIQSFLTKQSFDPLPQYRHYINWFFYRSAMKGWPLMTVIDELREWESALEIKILFRPRSLYRAYQELPYLNLMMTSKELENIVVIGT